jgi:hypothetical protein
MTVRKLIAELKKMPQNSEVYWQDHDHSQYEYNNKVGNLRLLDYNNFRHTDEIFKLEGKIVMLKP